MVFRKLEMINVNEILHRGIIFIIQLMPRYNSIITQKGLKNISENEDWYNRGRHITPHSCKTTVGSKNGNTQNWTSNIVPVYTGDQNTVEEKAKLKRALKFLKQKIKDNIVMGAENISQLCT